MGLKADRSLRVCADSASSSLSSTGGSFADGTLFEITSEDRQDFQHSVKADQT
jgi:hypothetical protein